MIVRYIHCILFILITDTVHFKMSVTDVYL